MEWKEIVQMATLVAFYMGGIYLVARLITSEMGKRIDDLKDRIVDVENHVDNRISDFRERMSSENSDLKARVESVAYQLDSVNEKLDIIKEETIRHNADSGIHDRG